MDTLCQNVSEKQNKFKIKVKDSFPQVFYYYLKVIDQLYPVYIVFFDYFITSDEFRIIIVREVAIRDPVNFDVKMLK